MTATSPATSDQFDVRAHQELRGAFTERSSAEGRLIEAIEAARESGMSWASVGNVVGTSGQAVRRR